MPENGVTGSTSFENLIREYRGRPPTAKETQRILACNRLLTTTDFDPVTVFLTIFGEEFDRSADRVEAAASMTEKALADFSERLKRVEQGAAQLDRMETKLLGLQVRGAVFAFGTYVGCFLLGVSVVLGGVYLTAQQHVSPPWVIWRATVGGAVFVLLLLWSWVGINQALDEHRFSRGGWRRG
jgi:hypothetical protein